jgi:hypothetical protein
MTKLLAVPPDCTTATLLPLIVSALLVTPDAINVVAMANAPLTQEMMIPNTSRQQPADALDQYRKAETIEFL